MLRVGRSIGAYSQKSAIRAVSSHSFVLKQRGLPSAKEMQDASALCEFAGTKDLPAMKKLLAGGASVNSADYDFRTPLHIAAAAGNADVVKMLLDNNAINIFDRFGGLPIHDAQRGNHFKCINLLKNQSTSLESMFVEGKHMDQQVQKVFDLISNEGVFSFSLIMAEIDNYYNRLGLDPIYFELFTPTQIAKHIHSFIAAKKVALISQTPQKLRVDMQSDDNYVAIYTDEEHQSVEKAVTDFMESSPDAFHTTFMRSKQPAIDGMDQHLCIYHVHRTKFENPMENSDDIYLTASADYLKTKPQSVIDENAILMHEAMTKPHPVIHITDVPGTNLKNLRIGHRTERQKNAGEHEVFSQQLHEVHARLGITDNVTKKYVDTFSNGLTIYSVFFQADDEITKKVLQYSSLAFLLPESIMTPYFMNGDISGHEYLYYHAVARFAYYFHAENNENFNELFKYFKNDKANADKLLSLGQSLGSETHSLPVLYSVMMRNLPVCKAMFIDMSKNMRGAHDGYEYPNMVDVINKVRDPGDREILHTMQLFNKSLTSTNLWGEDKSAVAYRIDPKHFLGAHRVPEIPFAVYMVLGYDFTGFHIRFRDISRGGVRVILSNKENYVHNRQTQFQENFNLAYTQKNKNKDIPESGSKGTILMKQGKNDKANLAFSQYVDSIMDICLEAPGVPKSDTEEVIFLGPDENTAHLMDGACTYTQDRNYGYWRAFTTGKSPTLGGIPHDTYGMTTRSVRQFVEGTMRKLKLDELECTKLIIGGPDGDLGSNEILLSKEKILGVVDGSGVLCDPNGLERSALEDLAHKRVMIKDWAGKLSPDGFLVLIDDANVTLPCGELVENGLDFRNKFHLWGNLKADFFVPCGGRPQSVNIDNVSQLFEADGVTPRFKNIVEGANLFITDAARNYLQDRGVPLFKDASTNKGGVTSSSLEVLAGLAMDDHEFQEHMCVRDDGSIPGFYSQYVDEIINIVEANARKEFEYIWDIAYAGDQKGDRKRSTDCTDALSGAMNDLNDTVSASNLYDNVPLRNLVLSSHIPECLVNKVGMETIIERVPENYLRAIFSMGIASKFIYQYGEVDSPYFFYKFMEEMQNYAEKSHSANMHDNTSDTEQSTGNLASGYQDVKDRKNV
jgi:glutamate dehydrogenase